MEEFLKKHKQPQAFDKAWKEIPCYPGLSVPNKDYCEITQWQGKEMGNLGRYISTVLASEMRNPDHSQYDDFKSAVKWASTLVDFCNGVLVLDISSRHTTTGRS